MHNRILFPISLTKFRRKLDEKHGKDLNFLFSLWSFCNFSLWNKLIRDWQLEKLHAGFIICLSAGAMLIRYELQEGQMAKLYLEFNKGIGVWTSAKGGGTGCGRWANRYTARAVLLCRWQSQKPVLIPLSQVTKTPVSSSCENVFMSWKRGIKWEGFFLHPLFINVNRFFFFFTKGQLFRAISVYTEICIFSQ